MAAWTAGYVADIGYTHGFYRELTPELLRFVCLSRGRQTPSAESLIYCELGCGQGLSLNLLASANPKVQFHATDFNSSQIAGARALVAEAVLSNITFYDQSFVDFVEAPDLPESFDVIALHGIYSWISTENRATIVEFIQRKLKVGGLVYISYNALPGWAAAMPLRRLFADRAAQMGGPIGPRVEQALGFVEQLKATNPAFFRTNPSLGDRFDRIKEQNRNYLAHEYFNRDWTPFYFADVAADLSNAKLSYVGSAALLEQVDAVNLTTEQQQLLAGIGDVAHRETIKDYMVNQQFRRDVFVKGPVTLSPRTGQEAWLGQRFALSTLRADIELKVTGSLGEATLQPEVYSPLLDKLADGPKTVREMVADPAISGLGWARLQQAVIVLVGAGHLQPCLPAKDDSKRAKTTKTFNQAVIERAQDNSDLAYLASPITGGGISVGRFQQLFLRAIGAGKKHPDEWADAAWQVLMSHGQKILKDGKLLESAEENLTELKLQAAIFAEKQLPVLRILGII